MLCALLLFFFARNRYGKHFLVLGVACLTLGLCCAPIVLQNNSDNIEDIESTEEVGGEIRYYIINKTSPPDACPEFKITSYDMELKLSNVLHADVKSRCLQVIWISTALRSITDTKSKKSRMRAAGR